MLELAVPELATKLPATISIPPTNSVVVLMYVNVPETFKLPPTFKSPPIPAPPVTTNAPVVVFVLAVVAAATTLLLRIVVLDAVNVVNAPVLAVEAPIGVLFTLPPVITALPEAKFVAVSVVTFSAVMPLSDPPVI